MFQEKRTLEWEYNERRFRFVYSPQGPNDLATLITPDGAIVELNRAEWRRVVLAVTMAFGDATKTSASLRKAAERPANVGKVWTPDLDSELATLWRKGRSIQDLASHFQRTRGGITARLVRLGLIQAPEQTGSVGTTVAGTGQSSDTENLSP